MKNVEIKARCPNPDHVRRTLAEMGARHVGTDAQTDTYFRVRKGRLKLREGDIENALIFYRRPDITGAKRSDIRLIPATDPAALRALLSDALGILARVEKRRDIYFLGQTKFHVDSVSGLGEFVEIEVIDADDTIEESELRTLCRRYMRRLAIKDSDLVAHSYSDMVLDRPTSVDPHPTEDTGHD